MRNKKSILTWIISAYFLCAISSCSPKLETAPAPLETYSIQAHTGDTYSFQILPSDPNEFKDEASPRSSKAFVTYAAKPEPKVPAHYSDDDFYCGTDRGDCKTTLNDVDFVTYVDLPSFLSTLPSDKHMMELGISKASSSQRVKEEKQNITIERAYIYAIKHEPDKDFHVIIGDKEGKHFFNIEVSGLPEEDQHDFGKLLAVRLSVQSFFDKRVRISEKYNKPDPPIPVRVSGSLFYDIDHAPGIVGPAGYRPNTSREIHPVSKIEFLKR